MKSQNKMKVHSLLFITSAFLAAVVVFNIAYASSFCEQTTSHPTESRVIMAVAESNGTISPEHKVAVTSGGSQTFTVTANSGYHIQDVLVDGTSIGGQTFYTFNNVTQDHTITALFSANEKPAKNLYGGPYARSKSINYMPYIFAKCPTPANRVAWVKLIKSLNFHVVNFYDSFVFGDFTPRQQTRQELKDTVAYFKANGIAVQMHTYSDLIGPESVLFQNKNNIRHNADGTLMAVFGGYVPTPAVSSVVANNLINAYIDYGFNGGIYFDAIDYYSGNNVNVHDSETAISFMNKVMKSIPGGCPVDISTAWSTGDQLYSRRGTIDTPIINPGGKDDPSHNIFTSLRGFADYHSTFVLNWTKVSTHQYVPFMGWLAVDAKQKYSVADLKYYLEKTKNMGGGYAIEGIGPSTYTVEAYSDPAIADYMAAIAAYNLTWNIKIITVNNTSGSPISSASVNIIDSNSSTVYTGTTNSSGYVVVNIGSSSGPYTIQVQSDSRTQSFRNNLASDTTVVFCY